MLYLFSELQSFFRRKEQQYFIDNWIFKLHYRATTFLFLLATTLVSLRQFIGDPIDCINDKGKRGQENVINNFCFFMSTFTVIKEHYNKDAIYPGIGNWHLGSREPIRKHTYYQWVPFVFFAESIMFYLTHLLWKKYENGTVKMLVEGLNRASFSFMDKEITDANGLVVPSVSTKQDCMYKIRSGFTRRLICHKSWTSWLMVCEVLNIFNVVAQAWFLNVFLGRQFLTLGPRFLRHGNSILDEVFPKMTKCIFYTYGHSGTIQNHDSLCIMALNIVHEKIFVALWFWFVFIFGASCAAVVWRFLTIVLHSKSTKFNQMVFAYNYLGKIHRWNLELVMKNMSFTDWIFLRYLAKNLDPLVFRELFLGLCQDLEEDKSLLSKPPVSLPLSIRNSGLDFS